MEDKFELVPYDMSRVKRPEYIMMNGKPLNIYRAKKVLDVYQYSIECLVEQNKILKEALTITDAHFRMQNKIYSTEDTVGSVALQQCIDL